MCVLVRLVCRVLNDTFSDVLEEEDHTKVQHFKSRYVFAVLPVLLDDIVFCISDNDGH